MQFSEELADELQKQIPSIFESYKAKIPWLNAVGIGKKLVNGMTTDEDVIVFFVGRKINKKRLTEDQLLPSTLKIAATTTETDVVEMPTISFLQDCNDRPERPARGGNCVSPFGSGWHGTLGGIVTDPSNGTRYIISNAHVLAGINRFGPGHPILQNHAGHVIAHLSRATQFSTTTTVRSDAAIAKVVHNSDVDPAIAGIGIPQGLARPTIGLAVQKSGLRTCHQTATIRYIGVTTELDSSHKISDVFLTDIMGGNGDSGSIILDMNDRVVGLLFGTSNTRFTAGCDVANVISDLGISGWPWF